MVDVGSYSQLAIQVHFISPDALFHKNYLLNSRIHNYYL